MPKPEPTVTEIQQEIIELLRTEEVAALATIDSEGHPSASQMHLAGDGLIAYMHTFTHTRKHGQMQQNPNVSYTIGHLPPEGYYDRRNTRWVQIQGRAVLVTDPQEIQHVAQISLEQFPWASDTSLYENIKAPDQGKQVLYRIEPVQGLWADHRIRLFHHVLLEFSEDGRTLTDITDYNAVVGRRTR
ncbi:pyridoxamine 5'-phosphate oxidase family protein [Nocardia pseudovaccinii]|uniref:pyridoxamine 5'-phosphate oxidase family protein n=1 Tax=Nocardia pseudovaccinii TaxID=189540 RepID=UPI0007A3816A|nr:pyridoxamine 5'-phosphate oxidase family protein [Nocardia pseudovaccinii]